MDVQDTSNKRLDRIEEKIDKLSEAMVAIARTEEKLLAMEQKYSAQYDRMNKFSEKLDRFEAVVIKNSQTVNNINKLFWAVLVAAIGAVASQMFM